jgi:hypothetical protein
MTEIISSEKRKAAAEKSAKKKEAAEALAKEMRKG